MKIMCPNCGSNDLVNWDADQLVRMPPSDMSVLRYAWQRWGFSLRRAALTVGEHLYDRRWLDSPIDNFILVILASAFVAAQIVTVIAGSLVGALSVLLMALLAVHSAEKLTAWHVAVGAIAEGRSVCNSCETVFTPELPRYFPDLLSEVDRPLGHETALEDDCLGRADFAVEVAELLLRQVSPKSEGFTVAIEGEWGCGKTSTIRMIQRVLEKCPKDRRPVIVHFNPWLIGERDALLTHFLSKIAEVVERDAQTSVGVDVAKLLRRYSFALAGAKLIHQASPFIPTLEKIGRLLDALKAALQGLGTDGGLEQKKRQLEAALRKHSRPIVVFLDDLDRLYPSEVFEMVRIVKAVGELPNIGYLIGWDAVYVEEALKAAEVPLSSSYLDKVVQARLPLPRPTRLDKERLFRQYVDAVLVRRAKESIFEDDINLLSRLYREALQELLSHPRDIKRVFASVGMFEPKLRDEIVLADIIGLAALMLKGPALFKLLMKKPQWFVGALDSAAVDNPGGEIVDGDAELKTVLRADESSHSLTLLLNFLFPNCTVDGSLRMYAKVEQTSGRIANPGRLVVALQRASSEIDVSITQVRLFLQVPDARKGIVDGLSEVNCADFLDALSKIARNENLINPSDLEATCVAVAEMLDTPSFWKRNSKYVDALRTDEALETIENLVSTNGPGKGQVVAMSILQSRRALTVSARLVQALLRGKNTKSPVYIPPDAHTVAIPKFIDNVVFASEDGVLLSCADPRAVLRCFAEVAEGRCPELFSIFEKNDSHLDAFVSEVLWDAKREGFGSVYYVEGKKDFLEYFCPLSRLSSYALRRCADSSTPLPAAAAWKSIRDGKPYYGNDGRPVDMDSPK